MREMWKDVVGYENEYQVSNRGNVKSLNYKGKGKERILKKTVSPQGYEVVGIHGKLKTVHRLVADAFIENPHNYPQINHIDENKTNNCADNLEWCTAFYNINYGARNQRASKPVIAMTKDGAIERYDSVKSASEAMGVTTKTLISALKKRHYTCRGRKWFYESHLCDE